MCLVFRSFARAKPINDHRVDCLSDLDVDRICCRVTLKQFEAARMVFASLGSLDDAHLGVMIQCAH